MDKKLMKKQKGEKAPFRSNIPKAVSPSGGPVISLRFQYLIQPQSGFIKKCQYL